MDADRHTGCVCIGVSDRYGRSLGSGPTTHIAVQQSRAEQPVAGVILQSPVLSMFRVVFNFRFTMPGDLFCNVDVIDQVESPVTIIHGTRDEVVPFWHGEGLFERCRQEWRCRPLWVADAGHNNIEAYLRYQALPSLCCGLVGTMVADGWTSLASEQHAGRRLLPAPDRLCAHLPRDGRDPVHGGVGASGWQEGRLARGASGSRCFSVACQGLPSSCGLRRRRLCAGAERETRIDYFIGEERRC